MSQNNLLHSSIIIPEWLQQLYSDDDKEKTANYPIPIKLLRSSGRTYLWSMVKLLNVDKLPGVAGQSCRLFERYMTIRISRITRTISYDQWMRARNELKSRLTLYLGVCIELTSKMFSMQDRITLSTLQLKMQKHGLHFSLEEFKEAELEVFQDLGFQIPLWTNVQKAQMLAREVGCTGILLDAVELVTDIAEYYRDRVLERVRNIAETPSSIDTSRESEAGPSTTAKHTSTGSIRDLHLIAGAVAATPAFIDCTVLSSELIPKLAFLTRSPISYIECIHNAIFIVLTRARYEKTKYINRFDLAMNSLQ